MTDAGLEHLKRLTKLKSLDLMGTQVTCVGSGTYQRIDETRITELEQHAHRRSGVGIPQGVDQPKGTGRIAHQSDG